jgi:hypothetical protein
MTDTLTPLSARDTTSSVKHQLRELNKKFHPILIALNQAAICNDRAKKLLEHTYNQERAPIINGGDHDQDPP